MVAHPEGPVGRLHRDRRNLLKPLRVTPDDKPPSQRPSPASTRAPSSSRVPPSSRPPPSSRSAGSRRSGPLVEIVSPLPPGHPADAPPEPPPPPPEEPAPGRPLGPLVAVGAMLLVPAVVLALVLAYVPKLRPWTNEASAPAGSAAGEVAVAEGKVLLAGRVVDSDGDPVEGARVTVLGGNRAVRLGEQTTGRGGVYSFEQDPGRFVLLAEHEEKGMVASADLMVASGAKLQNLVLALAPARALHGQVTSEDGTAVAGASLKIEGPTWLQRSATSEADGAYRIARVPSLDLTLRVVAPGYAQAIVRLRAAGVAGEETLNVKLAKESDVEGLVLDPENKPVRASIQACEGKEAGQRVTSAPDGKFKIAREFARCPLVAYHDAHAPSEPTLADSGAVTLRLRQGGSIAGLVVDESSGAVKSFYVGVESFIPAFGDRTHTVRGGEVRSFDDTEGAFKLDRLAPGSYVLSVGAEGRSPVRSPPVEVRAGQATEGVRVVLLRGGIVEGQVFDEEKRAPLAAARVSFDATSSVRREGVPPTFSDDAGKFRLEGAPAGPFSLRVEHEGYRTRLVAGLKVNSGETRNVEVALKVSGDGGTGLDFVGIGASIEQTRNGLLFRSIFEGSPAEKAGLRSGDLLQRIDGESAEGMSLADAIQRLRGEKGSQVRVTAERPPAGEFVDVVITRGEIVR